MSLPPGSSTFLWPTLFLGPLILGLVIFFIWPIFRTLYLSFTETGAFGGSTWVGLANYGELFSDPELPQALLNTAIYTVFSLVGIPLALVIAALLNTPGLKGRSVYRVLYFLPVVTMPAAIALVWKMIYNGDYGILNQLLGMVGVQGTSWLNNPGTVLLSVAIVGIWSSLGSNIVIFMAALQGVPPSLYEAAEMDGAGPVRRFLSVTVPMISPSVFFITVLSVIGALQVFDLVYVMIGPDSAALPHAKTIVFLFYETGFLKHNQGAAAAIAFVLLVIILALTIIQFSLQKKWVHYE
ncbi:carbohydrate ABC transporter permease [Propioniciclava coleopterorum]|uniref:carbohydrate ABC transporter permease n=1 Tax=Propioniciclava coleopterorum TaxID=2714937 RepID=UPI001FE2B820|nr:sugar ABC transporter permease [Propioniciclava coleopterorum]